MFIIFFTIFFNQKFDKGINTTFSWYLLFKYWKWISLDFLIQLQLVSYLLSNNKKMILPDKGMTPRYGLALVEYLSPWIQKENSYSTKIHILEKLNYTENYNEYKF